MRAWIAAGAASVAIIAAATALILWTRSPVTVEVPITPAPTLPAPTPQPSIAREPVHAVAPPAKHDAGVPSVVAQAPAPPEALADSGSDGDPLVLDDDQPEEPGKTYPPATEQTVTHELKTHAAALRSCYAAWPNPPFSAMRDMSVRLRVRHVAGAPGIRIDDVRATVDAPGRVAFEACARRALAGVRFSKALPEKEITLYLPQ